MCAPTSKDRYPTPPASRGGTNGAKDVAHTAPGGPSAERPGGPAEDEPRPRPADGERPAPRALSAMARASSTSSKASPRPMVADAAPPDGGGGPDDGRGEVERPRPGLRAAGACTGPCAAAAAGGSGELSEVAASPGGRGGGRFGCGGAPNGSGAAHPVWEAAPSRRRRVSSTKTAAGGAFESRWAGAAMARAGAERGPDGARRARAAVGKREAKGDARRA